jgi:hypothetical protein
MQVYQTDRAGFFINISRADPDPLTPGSWLIPGGCVVEKPPTLIEGQRAQWINNHWAIIDPEPIPEPIPEPELTAEELKLQIKSLRQAAYAAEADPLFFKWQAGEATELTWKNKRQEIRDRYPYAQGDVQ